MHCRFSRGRRAICGVKAPFEAVVSVPCFELWLLLHFEDVFRPLHRDEALARLRGQMADYVKGNSLDWAATREHQDAAMGRADALMVAGHKAEEAMQPCTHTRELVRRLLDLEDQAA